MQNITSFTKLFELETLKSEKLRAAILAWYALFAAIYISIISYLIKNDTSIKEAAVPLPHNLFYLLAALFCYEVIANRILDYRIKKHGKSIHPNFKYVNAFIELIIITVMLYIYTTYFQHNSILSDLVLISLYYLIVFLSASTNSAVRCMCL